MHSHRLLAVVQCLVPARQHLVHGSAVQKGRTHGSPQHHDSERRASVSTPPWPLIQVCAPLSTINHRNKSSRSHYAWTACASLCPFTATCRYGDRLRLSVASQRSALDHVRSRRTTQRLSLEAHTHTAPRQSWQATLLSTTNAYASQMQPRPARSLSRPYRFAPSLPYAREYSHAVHTAPANTLPSDTCTCHRAGRVRKGRGVWGTCYNAHEASWSSQLHTI